MPARDVTNRRLSGGVSTACLLLALAAMCWLVFGVRAGAASEVSLGDWIRIGGFVPWVVTLDFDFSESASLCLCTIAIVMAVTSWRATGWMCAANLGCLFGACMALTSTGLVLWWCGWVLTGFCAAVQIATETRATAPVAVRRFLTSSVFVDLVMMMGIAPLWIGLGSFDSAMLDHADFAQRAQGAAVPAIGGAIYLVFAILARVGAFPFIGWTHEVSGAGWRVFCAVRCGLFLLPALMLLDRWRPLWTHSPAAVQLLEGVGVLTVLIAGAVSLVRPHPVATLNGVMSGIVGLILVATAKTEWDLVWLAASSMLLFVATTVSVCGARHSSHATKTHKLMMWLPASLLLVMLNSLVAVNVLNRLEVAGSLAMIAGCWLGGMLATIAVMRVLFLANRDPAIRDPTDQGLSDQDSSDRTAVGEASPAVQSISEDGQLPDLESRRIVLGLTAISVLMICISGGWRLLALGIWLMPLVLSASIAWVLFAKASELPGQVARALGPLTRLSRQGFYIDDTVFFLLSMPLRGLAQAGRLMDWMVVEGTVVGLPAKFPVWIARSVGPLRSPSANLCALSMCLGLGVILVVVVWMWG